MLEDLIAKDKIDYKCYDELKRLIKENEQFRKNILEGIEQRKVFGFNDFLWDKIESQNIRRIDNFLDVFRDGANIGYCTVASKQLSYSLNTCFICGGVLPILKGTRNCPEGNHTWIVENEYVIDTTLMLIIDEEYSKKIGYIEMNRYDPNIDSIYRAAKEFTNDSNLRKKIK